MAVFDYTAILKNGVRVSGSEVASSAEDLIARLQERSALPVKVLEGGGARRRPFWLRLPRLGGGEGRSAVVVTAELCTLITAGLTVDRALTIVLDRAAPGELRNALVRVRDAVRGGKALADAVEAEPAVFSRVYVALVRAGEASGHLDQALGRLQAYLARGDTLRHQLQSALIYPAVLLAAGAGALLLLSNVVLPQFVAMFAEAGKALPLPTRIVLAANHALGATWPYMAGITVLVFLLARRAFADHVTRVRLQGVMLRTPVLGALWRNMEAARLTRTMAALLQSGVGIPGALGLSLEVLSNAAMKQGGMAALARIREGVPMSQAMLRERILPDVSIQLLAVGEETGRLDAMLLKQAELLEESAARRITTLLALLVPGLTIAIGLLVGSVMVAVMMAVLQLNDIVG